jgi:hypothetical protein
MKVVADAPLAATATTPPESWRLRRSNVRSLWPDPRAPRRSLEVAITLPVCRKRPDRIAVVGRASEDNLRERKVELVLGVLLRGVCGIAHIPAPRTTLRLAAFVGIQSTAPLRATVIGYDAGWNFCHPRPFGSRNDGTINRSKTGGPLCPPSAPRRSFFVMK